MKENIKYKMTIAHRLMLTEKQTYIEEKIYTSRSRMIKDYNELIRHKKNFSYYNSIFIYENIKNRGLKIIKGIIIAHDNY
jgi:hypothetical protein